MYWGTKEASGRFPICSRVLCARSTRRMQSRTQLDPLSGNPQTHARAHLNSSHQRARLTGWLGRPQGTLLPHFTTQLQPTTAHFHKQTSGGFQSEEPYLRQHLSTSQPRNTCKPVRPSPPLGSYLACVTSEVFCLSGPSPISPTIPVDFIMWLHMAVIFRNVT